VPERQQNYLPPDFIRRQKQEALRARVTLIALNSLTPLAVGIFSAGAMFNEHNRMVVADNAYELMSADGTVPAFIKGTGWVLSRFGHKEVEASIRRGQEIFKQRYYVGIPKPYWEVLDKLKL